MYRSREFTSMPFALAISCAIFLLMYKLVTNEPDGIVQENSPFNIHFGPVEVPIEPIRTVRQPPPEPKPVTRPPLPPDMPRENPDRPVPDLFKIDLPDLGLPDTGGVHTWGNQPGTGSGSASGDLTVLVAIRPLYPTDAAAQGLEGRVLVEFTVTALGLVKDPRVIEAEPRRVFDRAALRAIQKWKFKPYVNGGQAMERKATQEFEFKLEDAR